MKKLIPILFLFAAAEAPVQVLAQKKLYLSQHPVWEEWSDAPRLHPVEPQYASQPATMLLNDVRLDYRREGRNDIVKYSTQHVVIKVLDQRGIDQYSTVTIPLDRGTKVPEVKARTISPNGRIQNVDKKRVLVATNEQGNYELVIPMEGVVKNAEIEYVVKEVNSCDNFGLLMFQYNIPVQKTRFMLSYGKDMVVESRSYNGFPDLTPVRDNNRMEYKVELSDIPARMPEPHGLYDMYRMAFEYRISYLLNGNAEKIKLNTYQNLVKKIYEENYNFSKEELESANRFLVSLGVRPHGNEVANIKKIEQGIKKKITLYPFVNYEERKEVLGTKDTRSMSVYAAGYDARKNPIDSIISKGAASYKGYLRLFAACLRQAGIEHEIGWAWDRADQHINPGFESWRGLNYTLIYFPREKTFLAPTETYLRYPVVPAAVAGSRGVFLTERVHGDMTRIPYHIRTITPLSDEETRMDVTAAVQFDKNMNAKVDVSDEWYGYTSEPIRKKLPFVRPEDMKEYVNGLLGLTTNPGNIETYSFSNTEENSYSENKPLALYAALTLPDLVNKAGGKYLVRVGALIGPQPDLFTDNKRTMPVDIRYPQSYNRTITVHIPKGYKVLNPEAVRMHADYLNGELDNVVSFDADYRIERNSKLGDKLIISVKEDYKQTLFPVYEYEQYRKIYNMAADFNNVSLVLARK